MVITKAFTFIALILLILSNRNKIEDQAEPSTYFSANDALNNNQAFDFDVKDGILRSYRGSSDQIVIPANLGIIEIGEDAFSFRENLIMVEIPEGVKIIGSGAFYSCSSPNTNKSLIQ